MSNPLPAEVEALLGPLAIPDLTKPLLWQRLSPLIGSDKKNFLQQAIDLLQQEMTVLQKKKDMMSLSQPGKMAKYSGFKRALMQLDALVQPYNSAIKRYTTNVPHDYSVAQQLENSWRNRYSNILASEEWRVKCSDGIYRNYSHFGTRRILGQAPKESTFSEFFGMVMDKQIDAIVCLTAPTIGKMEPYWNDDGVFFCGHFEVKVLSKEEDGNYVRRQLEISLMRPKVAPAEETPMEEAVPIEETPTEEMEEAVPIEKPFEFGWTQAASKPPSPSRSRSNSTDSCCGEYFYVVPEMEMEVAEKHVVSHIMYTGWPDSGVPQNVAEFDKLVDMMEPFEHCLIHCSAGIGRTGTLITVETFVDFVLFIYHNWEAASQLAVPKNPTIFIPEELIQFTIPSLILVGRKYRDCLVQSEDQLTFCYQAIVSALQELQKS